MRDLGRPTWVLRPGGKVEPLGKRGTPPDALYLCREGDREWTPIGPSSQPPIVPADEAGIYWGEPRPEPPTRRELSWDSWS